MGGIGEALNTFTWGTGPEQVGQAQTNAQRWMTDLLYPMIQQGVQKGMAGQGLYDVGDAPTPGYDVPQAPFSSPADMIQSGEMNTAQNLREQFYGGGGGGSAMGGVGGQGQVFDSNLAAQMAQGATGRFAQMQLPYDQMQNQQGVMGFGAQMQQYGAQNQANAAPWGVFPGMYNQNVGNAIIDERSPGAMGVFGK